MKQVAALLALALASIALVACGGGGSSDETATGGAETTSEAGGGGATKEEGGGGTSSTVSFEADPGGALAYTTTKATAKAGKVTIDFNNPQALTHDVAIEGPSGEEVGATELITEGEDSTTVELKPGAYHFFCS